MRLPIPIFETFLLLAIAFMALVNVAIYTEVVVGADRNVRARGGLLEGLTERTPEGPTPAQVAEADASPALPGRYVPSQGKRHTAAWPLDERVPYCVEGAVRDDCYASLPPTSGLHLPVQRGVVLGGSVVTLPPDPGIYTFDMPREAIPHLQEHAGVFVGFNCESDTCRATVLRMGQVVQQELSVGSRVIMAPFSDLPPDSIGLAAWTRVDTFAAADYTDERVRAFIKAHSCRFDPEGFCLTAPLN
jgi:hypothetical protein